MHESRLYFYSFDNTSLCRRPSSSVMDTAKMKPLTKANHRFVYNTEILPAVLQIIFLFSFEDEHYFAHCYQL